MSVRVLLHLPLSPHCRKVRLALAEKRLAFELRVEKAWEHREEFVAMNPAGTVPVLIEDSGLVVPDSAVICEYLDEAYPDTPLLGRTLAERVEVRRLVAWFEGRFAADVSANLIDQKYIRRIASRGQPDAAALRVGYANLRDHLGHVGWLAETRKYLAGNFMSLADCAAAAHLSALDFLGDVDWTMNAAAREWYARMKSRPSFRSILTDRVPGMTPPDHYADLDF